MCSVCVWSFQYFLLKIQNLSIFSFKLSLCGSVHNVYAKNHIYIRFLVKLAIQGFKLKRGGTTGLWYSRYDVNLRGESVLEGYVVKLKLWDSWLHYLLPWSNFSFLNVEVFLWNGQSYLNEVEHRSYISKISRNYQHCKN